MNVADGMADLGQNVYLYYFDQVVSPTDGSQVNYIEFQQHPTLNPNIPIGKLQVMNVYKRINNQSLIAEKSNDLLYCFRKNIYQYTTSIISHTLLLLNRI